MLTSVGVSNVRFIDKEKFLNDLVEKLTDNIALMLDEYTIYFVIASFFLLVILLNVVNTSLNIIHTHASALFKTISSLFRRS